VHWTPQPWFLEDVAFGNGFFLATSQSNILASSDGLTWSNIYTFPTAYFVPQRLSAIRFEGGRFAVGGWTATNYEHSIGAVWTSTNGQRWDQCYQVPNPPQAFVAGNGLFVAFNWPSKFTITAPGYSAIYQQLRDQYRLNNFAFGNGKFVGVGAGGLIMESDSYVPGMFTASRRSNQMVELGVSGLVGRHYRLQSATEPNSPFWSDLSDFTLGGPYTNVVTALDGSARSYRLASP
jgi:hypothetical protein